MASGTGIGEFFISLTVDAADGAINVSNLVQGLGNLEVVTLAEIGLLWELGLQLARVTDEGIKSAFAFAQFTMHTGLSARELQKWQIVAQQAHASADDVTGTVENLTRKLADLETGGTGGGALGALQRLFIAPFGPDNKVKTAFQILDEVRQKLGIIKSAGQQEAILGALGVSPNLRETLLLSQNQFEGLAAAAHGMTSGQQKDFDDMRQSFQRIHLIAQDIGRDIGDWVAHLDKAVGALKFTESFFRGVRDVLEGGGILKPSPEQVAREQAGEAKIGEFLSGGFLPQSKASGADVVRRLLDSLTAPNDRTYVSPDDYAKSINTRDALAGRTVLVDKHDVYNIYDAHDPEKVKEVIEKHWDETLSKKTIDGFDRQNNNGGF